MRIYVDIDETLAEYSKSVQAGTGEFPQSAVGFFRKLPLKPGAQEGIKKLNNMGHLVNFATRPSYKNPHCFTDKAMWTLENFGWDAYMALIITPDKSLLIGDVLIDDHFENGQPNFKGFWFKFGSPECPDWESVVEMVELIDSVRIAPDISDDPETAALGISDTVTKCVKEGNVLELTTTILSAVKHCIDTMNATVCLASVVYTNPVGDMLLAPRRIAASRLRSLYSQLGESQHDIDVLLAKYFKIYN